MWSSIKYVRSEGGGGGSAKSELTPMGWGERGRFILKRTYAIIFFSQARYKIEIK